MKTLKYLTAAGLLAAAAAAVATEGSSVISEQAGAKNSTVTADVAVQAPTPAVKQKTAKAEVMNGFAVHSKQFCASCHGKEGIADTPNWPDVAGQPYAVTVKALLDYRDGRRKGTPASDLMSAAAAKLSNQQIADVAALYEYLPGRNAKKAAPATPTPELVNSGDASRYITPCAACHGIDARGNNNGLVPVLHSQQATVLAAALKDYRSGARQSDMLGEMRVFSRKLTDAEIEQLANWYAAQPGRVGQEEKKGEGEP